MRISSFLLPHPLTLLTPLGPGPLHAAGPVSHELTAPQSLFYGALFWGAGGRGGEGILLHLFLKPGYIAGEGDVRDGAQLVALNATRRIHI